MPTDPIAAAVQTHPIVTHYAARTPERNKVVSAAAAVRLIRDGDTFHIIDV